MVRGPHQVGGRNKSVKSVKRGRNSNNVSERSKSVSIGNNNGGGRNKSVKRRSNNKRPHPVQYQLTCCPILIRYQFTPHLQDHRLFRERHLLFQFVSQGSEHVLPIRNQNSPYQGFWHSEVHFRRLQIRIDSQSVRDDPLAGFQLLQ